MATGIPILYLASQSPRRQEFLRQLGVPFVPLAVEIDEDWDGREDPVDYVRRLAVEKAMAGCQRLEERHRAMVLAADTAVVVAGQVLGKPGNEAEGREMLQKLSARTHEVLTGVALACVGDAGALQDDWEADRIKALVSRSEVSFRALHDSEITAYWASGEGRDKAGGYAIQGGAAVFIHRLIGSWSGVVGLPLFETAELLRSAGLPCGPARPIHGLE